MRRYLQPQPSHPRISLKGIPTGYLGTGKTLDHIQALIRQGVKDFYVRQKAIDILLERGVKPKDYFGEIRALFEWVQKNIRYTKDPFRVEVLHTARRMLELGAGDCDDITILLGAMLEAIGHPIRLVIVGPDPFRPLFFTHIYLEVHHKNRWIPLDATMPFPIGWAARRFVKKIIPVRRKYSQTADVLSSTASTGVMPSTNWLLRLVRAVAVQAIAPRDPRVKKLIRLLRDQQFWTKDVWLRRFLLRIWRYGWAAQPSPYTARRMTRLLRRWKLLPVRGAPRRETAQREARLNGDRVGGYG